jgi:hypothetical protein
MGFFSKQEPKSVTLLSPLAEARKAAQVNQQVAKEVFEAAFKKARKILGEYSVSRKAERLKDAGNEFLNLIESNPSRVEPYVYMAYIFSLYRKKIEAIKYLRHAESINRDYPFIKDVRTCVFG